MSSAVEVDELLKPLVESERVGVTQSGHLFLEKVTEPMNLMREERTGTDTTKVDATPSRI